MINLELLFYFIIKIFWKSLQEFFLLKLLILSKIQKIVLTILGGQLVITSLNLNHAVANSAYNFSKFEILLYPIKLPIKDVNVQNSDFFKFSFNGVFNRYDLWVKI